MNKQNQLNSSLQWCHNEHNGVLNHQPHDCLFSRLFRRRSKKHQSSVSLAFVWGIHRWSVNSSHKWPVTRKMISFDDVIMLGIVIDEYLQWGEHAKHVKGTISRRIGILCKARKRFNVDKLKTLYYAFLFPHLYYYIDVWGNTLNVHIDLWEKNTWFQDPIEGHIHSFCSKTGKYLLYEISKCTLSRYSCTHFSVSFTSHTVKSLM